MTLKEFLAKGHEITTGDLLLGDGRVWELDIYSLVLLRGGYDRYNNFYILYAKALNQVETREEKEALDAIEKLKPKHTNTKVEYVKIDCQSLEFWECAKEYQSEAHVYWKDSEGKQVIQDLNQLVEHYRAGIIYRKVAREPTERELFINTALDVACEPIDSLAFIAFGRLYESGKFKLVDGK